MYSSLKLYISFLLVLFSFMAVSQTFQHLTVISGFTHDVIANGPGPAVNSSTAGVDSTGLTWANCLMSADFQPNAAPPPAYALPVSGLVNSASTANLSFQLAAYNQPNSLWLNYQNSGTLVFSNQIAASRLYILVTSGHGPSNANGIIHFTDNTTQNFGPINCPDWFNGTNPPVAISGIGRVFRATSGIDNAFNNPRLYQYSVIIQPANILKQIASVQFNKTNPLGVTNIFAVTAELSPCPIIDLLEDDFSICPDADSTLFPNISNAIEYEWSDGSTASTLNVNDEGTYWVTVETSQCTYSDTVSVSLLETVIPFSLGDDMVLCQNEIVTLSPDLAQDGQHTWSDGSSDGWLSVSGANVFWLEISNVCGSFRDSISTSIQLGPEPFSLGPDIVFCQGESVTVGTSMQPDMTYLWQNGTSSNSLEVNQGGNFWLRIFNDCGLVADTIHASIPATPIVVLPQDTILCDNATLLVVPIVQNETGIFWSDYSTQSNYLVTEQGIFTCNAFNQCDTVVDQIEIEYMQTPTVFLGSDLTPCEGETVDLFANNNGYNVVWWNGEMGNVNSANASGLYWASSSNFCGIATDTMEVRYIMNPIADLGEDLKLCEGETAVLQVSQNRAEYLWSNGSIESSISVEQEGVYSVTVFNECSLVTDTIEIDFEDCSCIIFIPNTFTPDADGLNDVFQPRFYCDFELYHLQVFNTWGQLIYETYEPSQPWDGAHLEGEYFVKDGVYAYRLKYKPMNSIEPLLKRGLITILR